jgi:hypothetical protein
MTHKIAHTALTETPMRVRLLECLYMRLSLRATSSVFARRNDDGAGGGAYMSTRTELLLRLDEAHACARADGEVHSCVEVVMWLVIILCFFDATRRDARCFLVFERRKMNADLIKTLGWFDYRLLKTTVSRFSVHQYRRTWRGGCDEDGARRPTWRFHGSQTRWIRGSS